MNRGSAQGRWAPVEREASTVSPHPILPDRDPGGMKRPMPFDHTHTLLLLSIDTNPLTA
jgi:hypothetical protein